MAYFHKSITEYNLCMQIIENQKNIFNELNIILNQQNGYKYNSRLKKIKKHFPATIIENYDDYKNFLIKNKVKNKKVSFSVSSKNIIEQINNFLLTSERRYNTLNIFNNNIELLKCLITKNLYNLQILTPLDMRYNLNKYNGFTQIKNKFPEFVDKNRLHYDVIYIIKTENPHFYIDATNTTLCDTILICCSNKIFNIMFELDINNKHYRDISLTHLEKYIQKIYNNTNI